MQENTVRGPCGLCREHADLKRSHVMPAWAYRKVRGDDHRGNPNPVRVSGGKAATTSQQLWRHFLCSSCEALFSRAEGYAATLARTTEDSFPLLSHLDGAPHVVTGNLSTVVVNTLKSDILAYFALSILWRADVMEGWVSLGPYKEPLRRFLLGQDPFPRNVHVTLNAITRAARSLNLDRMFTSPLTARSGQCRVHMFVVCGMEFLAWIGGTQPPDIERFCLACSMSPEVIRTSTEQSPSSIALLRLAADVVNPHAKRRVSPRSAG